MKKDDLATVDKNLKNKVRYFWLFSLLPFFIFVGLFLFQSESSLPPVSMMENPPEIQASIIFGAQGDTMGRYWRINRTSAKFQDISPYVFDALIATEDERFFDHSGVDFKSLLRSVSSFGGAGGASTISQQLAKLMFTIEERKRTDKKLSSFGLLGKIQRINEKARENIISVRLESRFTKEELLTMYLNQFDFLYNAVGIQNASKAYFNKLPNKLTKIESATLVGMCKNPALYNPYSFKLKNYRNKYQNQKNPKDNINTWCLLEREKDSMRAVQRRNQVLFQWLKNSQDNNSGLRTKLTKEEYDLLCKEPLVITYQVVDHKEGKAPYFKEALRKELSELFKTKNANGSYKYVREDGIPYDIYNDGLKIYTTIDARMQEHAEKAVDEHIRITLQPLFNSNNANLKNYPFSNSINNEQVESIMRNARKSTLRYKLLMEKGYSVQEINKNFNVPTQMKVFSWKKGEVDTVMSPNDSIRYYKAFLHCGLVSIEPKTGFVKAWVGGVNFKHFAYDHVRLGKRQVGSTIKPFVYAAAIESGAVKPNTRFGSGDYCITLINEFGEKAGKYCPRGSAQGTVANGLAFSSNPTTVAVMAKMGPFDMKNKTGGPFQINNLLMKLGIKLRQEDIVPPMCLGSMDLSLFELVSAQCVFPNNGVYVKASAIERIEDRNGRIIYAASGDQSQALNSSTAFEIIKMMKGVVDKGTGRGLRGGRYGKIPPTAGKTGTTQNNSDGWFIGITPSLVTGIWVGAEDRSVRFKSTGIGQGARVALPIYGLYMQRVYKDARLSFPTLDFDEPEDYSADIYDAPVVSSKPIYEYVDTVFDW